MLDLMYTPAEDIVDLDLLRRISVEGGLETDGNRYPAGVTALMREGFVKEVAVGVGGYVCWKVTARGHDALKA